MEMFDFFIDSSGVGGEAGAPYLSMDGGASFENEFDRDFYDTQTAIDTLQDRIERLTHWDGTPEGRELERISQTIAYQEAKLASVHEDLVEGRLNEAEAQQEIQKIQDAILESAKRVAYLEGPR